MLLRRMGPALLPHITTSAYTGESAQVVKQFGDVSFREKTTRHSDTTFDELLHKQRWVFPTDFVLTIPVDKEDELKMLDSPLSPYAEAGRLAYGKKIDDIVFASFFGTAQTGKRGTTATAHVTTDDIAAGGTGLTLAKLRSARKILKQRNVDLRAETPRIAVNAKAMDDLLGETTIQSADYNTIKALVNGEVDTFMGFKFVPFEGIEAVSSAYALPVWVPSAIRYGQWNGLVTRIGERADKDYLTQVHMSFSAGATRTMEEKVLKVSITS